MKDSNRKFEGFAHNLIAESLKRWARHSPFVADKLKERLRHPIDELDRMIAETMFDSSGEIVVTATAQNYEYVPGETKVRVNKPSKY